MTQKTLIIIACLVAVVGGGVYVFLTYPLVQAPGTVVVPTTTVEYRSAEYGFNFPLPDSWKGYVIVTSSWEGMSIPDAQGETRVASGTIISIRHPLWTKENQRQDVPIMVFTLAQWTDLQAEKFHIGAAPIGPSELGRNAKYVFALPARYNYAFPAGFEEVEQVLSARPLQAF